MRIKVAAAAVFTMTYVLFLHVCIPALQAQNVAEQLQTAFSEVAEQASPAVVIITNKRIRRQPLYPQMPRHFYPFFGIPDPEQRFEGQEQQRNQEPVPVGKGSGIIVRGNGYIVTNYHVIKDHDALEIKLSDGRIFDSAKDKDAIKIQGVDQETDLAVISIGNGKLSGLPTLKFADSDKVRIGEWAIAIGAPFELDYSVTVGVVSQKGRADVKMNTYENYIQTDASINPGNSGGPLLNIKGEIIGVNNFIFTGGGMSRGSVGIGFAIASNLSRQVVDSLIDAGEVVRPWLGIAMQALTEEFKTQFGVERGVIVSDVMKGDPADVAGIQAGDVILKIGDKEVRTPHDVQFAVLSFSPGSKITVLVDRRGERKTFTVTARRKDSAAMPEVEDDTPEDLLNKLGLKLEEQKGKVVVVSVFAGTPADASRLRRGDIILEVNRHEVKNSSEVVAALRESSHAAAVFYIQRGGRKFFESITMAQD